MSQAQPTIWMNVTTSKNWNRPPVGIVRVEQALESQLAKIYGDNFRQCIWEDGKFIAYNARQIDTEIVSPRAGGKKNPKPQPPLMFPLLSKRSAVHSISQGLLSLTPGLFRAGLNRFFYRVRWRLARVLNLSLFLKIRIRLAKGKQERVDFDSDRNRFNNYFDPEIFREGDVLVSVGLDWDSPSYESFYYLRQYKKVKVVTCCYDLIPVFYPQYCVGEVSNKFTSYFLEIADGSDLILCISNQTKIDLENLLESTGGANPATHVFTLGDNVPQLSYEPISPEIQALGDEPFLLYVSTIERRKNHEVLYRAYNLLASQHPRDKLPKLVFVGMAGWGVADLMNDIELDPVTSGLIVQLNNVSDSELAFLYSRALFCLYPSLYEGWGLPVGEALSMGKLILSSDRGSLPEVGGDLVEYINPWDVNAWAAQMWRYIADSGARLEAETRIAKNYKPHSWEQAATSVKGAIQGIILSNSKDKIG